MTALSNLAFMDATAQAELVRSKEVKPIELVEAAIERIEDVNPKINAVITKMYDQAEGSVNNVLPEGPFTGVPFLLKDLLATYAGVPLSSGSVALKNFIPHDDSEIVKRYKKAGLVILGKTNTPEFGILPSTEPVAFGATRNPWNVEYTAGGSSGGSAAAVASGLVPMAHGNDGGGSIRIPASCCGVFGLKPTRGRNSLAPRGDIMGGLVVEHAITRSVRDSAALLDVTSGPMPGDPYYAPPNSRPFLQEVGENPGKLRIAFILDPQTGFNIQPDCLKAVEDSAQLCSELGHHVEEIEPTFNTDLLSQMFTVVWTSGVATALESITQLTGQYLVEEDFETLTWTLYEFGKDYTATNYMMAIQFLQLISRQIVASFAEYDMCIMPTLAEPPVKLGTFDAPADNPLASMMRASQFVGFSPIANITGQPAMSVPLYWNDDGLPIGVQFIGSYGDEASLFRLAAQLESARPWANRHPPISAK